VHVDSRKLDNVDIVANADDLSMFEDDSVDLIYASHILEHFGRNSTQSVLKEWNRVLKSGGGVLRLAVPDFNSVVDLYSERKNIKEVMGLVCGGQTYPDNYHYAIFDEPYLTELLKAAGFKTVRRWDWRETEHSSVDDFSQAYFPHMQKETGKLMSLNIEAIK
jgi:predicted SAM-dependent methyltransferase